MLKTPLVIVNFKAYKPAVGKNAVKLAKICERAAKQGKAGISVAVQPADIYPVSRAVSIPVIAQHLDSNGYGQFTGSVLAESIKENGAAGSLINHSEKRIKYAEIAKIVKKLKRIKLSSIVCAKNPAEAKKISALKPDFIAIEPPELIGGKISVSAAKPWVITAVTKLVKNVPILCGAGIRSREDVVKAKRLGVKGILVSSGVVNAEEPSRVLKELIKGLK